MLREAKNPTLDFGFFAAALLRMIGGYFIRNS
jgi:hypothetical protein